MEAVGVAGNGACKLRFAGCCEEVRVRVVVRRSYVVVALITNTLIGSFVSVPAVLCVGILEMEDQSLMAKPKLRLLDRILFMSGMCTVGREGVGSRDSRGKEQQT